MIKIDHKHSVATSCSEVIEQNKCPSSCSANWEGYCGGCSRGKAISHDYLLKNSNGERVGNYWVSSFEFKEPFCGIAKAPSNYRKTRLLIEDSIRETWDYADGRKKIVLDTPKFKRIREKINGKWVLTEYIVKGNNKFDNALVYKDEVLAKWNVTSAKVEQVLKEFSGLAKKELEKLTKAMLENSTTVAKVLIRK